MRTLAYHITGKGNTMTLDNDTGKLDYATALSLIRTLPGDARIIHTEILANKGLLLFQWESGIQIEWAGGPDMAFCITTSDRLRNDWARWKAEREPK